jgi:hypothetical protein
MGQENGKQCLGTEFFCLEKEKGTPPDIDYSGTSHSLHLRNPTLVAQSRSYDDDL